MATEHTKSGSIPAASQSPIIAHAFNADRPINSPREDLLGVDGFVRRLVGPLLHAPADGSLVVGLYGRWGHGKSSALNLLERAFNESVPLAGTTTAASPRAIVVRFTPWLYSSVETLLAAFFETLASSIGGNQALNKAQREKWKKALRAMGEFVAPAIRLGALVLSGPAGAATTVALSSAGTIADVAQGAAKAAAELVRGGEASFRKRRDEAAHILQTLAEGKHPSRVVVLIDDLDRAAGADEVFAMLKLVKLVADLPNVSYVIAMDRERVQDLVQRSAPQAYSDDFLEKIIQIPLSLPPVEPRHLSQLVVAGAIAIAEQAGLDASALGVDWEGWEILRAQTYERRLRPALRTLRDVARVLNAFRFALLTGDRPATIHPVDLLLLCVLQALYPPVYEAVRRNRRFLLHEDLDDVWPFSRGHEDRERTRKRRRARLDEIAGVQRTAAERDREGPDAIADVPRPVPDALWTWSGQPALDILEFLFPYAVSGRPGDDDRQRQIERNEGRIRSPERFDGYFRLEPAAGEVSRHEVETVYRLLVEAVPPGCTVSMSDSTSDATDASHAADDGLLANVMERLARVSETERQSLYGQLDDRAAAMTRNEAQAMSRALPLLARHAADSDAPVRLVKRLAGHIITSMTSYQPDKDETQEREDAQTIGQLLEQLVNALPTEAAAKYALKIAKDRELQQTLPPEARRAIIHTGMERIAGVIASHPNIFEARDALDGWKGLWLWRHLVDQAEVVPEDQPYPPLQTYLEHLLADDPRTLTDVIALAAGWGEIPSLQRQSTTDIRRSLGRMVDLQLIERLAQEANELETTTPGRWPWLIEEFVDRLAQPSQGESPMAADR